VVPVVDQEAVRLLTGDDLSELSPRAYGPRNLMKVAGVATKWKRNVAATQVLNPLLSVALSRLSTLLERPVRSGMRGTPSFGLRRGLAVSVLSIRTHRIPPTSLLVAADGSREVDGSRISPQR
jgi:hypothetical protein